MLENGNMCESAYKLYTFNYWKSTAGLIKSLTARTMLNDAGKEKGLGTGK